MKTRKRIVRRLSITEVSAVDRPAVEHATLAVMKREPVDDPAAELRADIASFLAADPKKQDPLDLLLLPEREKTLLNDQDLVERVEQRNFELRERAKAPHVKERLDELRAEPVLEADDKKQSDILLIELESIAEKERRTDESHVDSLRRLESSGRNQRFNEILRQLRERTERA